MIAQYRLFHAPAHARTIGACSIRIGKLQNGLASTSSRRLPNPLKCTSTLPVQITRSGFEFLSGVEKRRSDFSLPVAVGQVFT